MIDISKEGYELSSELFSFKDMRRGVIEHGKACYIEGYKKHIELFNNFLLKNGYFSKEELNKIIAEFDSYLNDAPAVTISYAEDIIGKLYPWLPKDAFLTQVQKDIIDLYINLPKDKNKILIQKPRQKGITTACKIIAYIEALNRKNVFYAGYGKCDPELKKLPNFTYKEIHTDSNLSLCSKKYDLIIIDEITYFHLPHKIEKDLETELTANGRMILIGTPVQSSRPNYKQLKDFFTSQNTSVFDFSDKLVYSIHPDNEDYNKAEKYPEYKNEILGQWNN